jgi:flagellar assembly protein FliH
LGNVIKSQKIRMGEQYQLEQLMAAIAVNAQEQQVKPAESETMVVARKMLSDARQEAVRIESDAIFAADNLRAETERECALLREQTENEARERGYTKGYTEGFDQGVKEAHKENKQIAEALQTALADLEAEWDEHISKNLDDLKDLAIDVAAKVVQRELETDPKIFIALIEEALRSFRNYNWVDIWYSPDAEPLIVQVEKELAEKLTLGNKNFKIRPLATLPAGSLLVETNAGVADVGAGSQIEEIRSFFQDSINGG